MRDRKPHSITNFLQSLATWETENKIYCKQTLLSGSGPKTFWTRELKGDELELVSSYSSLNRYMVTDQTALNPNVDTNTSDPLNTIRQLGWFMAKIIRILTCDLDITPKIVIVYLHVPYMQEAPVTQNMWLTFDCRMFVIRPSCSCTHQKHLCVQFQPLHWYKALFPVNVCLDLLARWTTKASTVPLRWWSLFSHRESPLQKPSAIRKIFGAVIWTERRFFLTRNKDLNRVNVCCSMCGCVRLPSGVI